MRVSFANMGERGLSGKCRRCYRLGAGGPTGVAITPRIGDNWLIPAFLARDGRATPPPASRAPRSTLVMQYIYTMIGVSKVVPPKREIIKDISLSFFPGAKIGLLGLNGSGKSTVLRDRKSTRLNSSHPSISYAVFCLKKKKKQC